MTNGVILLPDRNHRKKDWKHAFRPYAKKFQKVHEIPDSGFFEIDISASEEDRKEQVLESIKKASWDQGTLRVIAFFCHGWKSGLQLGFDLDNVSELAQRIALYSLPNVVVPLFACSAGMDNDNLTRDDYEDSIGGDGGFADWLRDELCWASRLKCRVMAHVGPGHTAHRPFVRYFEGNGNPYGGAGGFWVIRPWGPLWKQWVKWLNEGTNCVEFPLKSAKEIRKIIGKRSNLPSSLIV
jgi:hypothetical protein